MEDPEEMPEMQIDLDLLEDYRKIRADDGIKGHLEDSYWAKSVKLCFKITYILF